MAKLKTYRVINSQEVRQEYHQIVKATSEAKAIEKAQDCGDWGEPVEESCNGDSEYEAEEIEDED